MFPDLNASPGGEDFQTNLIMPEPCLPRPQGLPALLDHSPDCRQRGRRHGRGQGLLTDDGLFGSVKSKAFSSYLKDLAEDADEATRGH